MRPAAAFSEGHPLLSMQLNSKNLGWLSGQPIAGALQVDHSDPRYVVFIPQHKVNMFILFFVHQNFSQTKRYTVLLKEMMLCGGKKAKLIMPV